MKKMFSIAMLLCIMVSCAHAQRSEPFFNPSVDSTGCGCAPDVTAPTIITCPTIPTQLVSCAGGLVTIPPVIWDDNCSKGLVSTTVLDNISKVIATLNTNGGAVTLSPGTSGGLTYKVIWKVVDLSDNSTTCQTTFTVKPNQSDLLAPDWATGYVRPKVLSSPCGVGAVAFLPEWVSECVDIKEITLQLAGMGVNFNSTKLFTKTNGVWNSYLNWNTPLPAGNYTATTTFFTTDGFNVSHTYNFVVPNANEFSVVNTGGVKSGITKVPTELSIADCRWNVRFSQIASSFSIVKGCDAVMPKLSVTVRDGNGVEIYSGPAIDHIWTESVQGNYTATFTYSNGSQSVMAGKFPFEIKKWKSDLAIDCDQTRVIVTGDCTKTGKVIVHYDYATCGNVDHVEWVKVTDQAGNVITMASNPTPADTVFTIPGILNPGNYTYIVRVGTHIGLEANCLMDFTVPPVLPTVTITSQFSATTETSLCGLATVFQLPNVQVSCGACLMSGTFEIVGESGVHNTGTTGIPTTANLLPGNYTARLTYMACGNPTPFVYLYGFVVPDLPISTIATVQCPANPSVVFTPGTIACKQNATIPVPSITVCECAQIKGLVYSLDSTTWNFIPGHQIPNAITVLNQNSGTHTMTFNYLIQGDPTPYSCVQYFTVPPTGTTISVNCAESTTWVKQTSDCLNGLFVKTAIPDISCGGQPGNNTALLTLLDGTVVDSKIFWPSDTVTFPNLIADNYKVILTYTVSGTSVKQVCEYTATVPVVNPLITFTCGTIEVLSANNGCSYNVWAHYPTNIAVTCNGTLKSVRAILVNQSTGMGQPYQFVGTGGAAIFPNVAPGTYTVRYEIRLANPDGTTSLFQCTTTPVTVPNPDPCCNDTVDPVLSCGTLSTTGDCNSLTFHWAHANDNCSLAHYEVEIQMGGLTLFNGFVFTNSITLQNLSSGLYIVRITAIDDNNNESVTCEYATALGCSSAPSKAIKYRDETAEPVPQIMLAPNPVTVGDDIVITSDYAGEQQVQVFSTDGRLVYDQTSKGIFRVNTTGFAPGMFVAKVIQNGKVLTTKQFVVVQ